MINYEKQRSENDAKIKRLLPSDRLAIRAMEEEVKYGRYYARAFLFSECKAFGVDPHES